MATHNYDEIRIGNALRVQAADITERELRKNYEPEEHDQHRKRIRSETEDKLTIAHNEMQLANIPISGTQVTEANKNTPVIRYSLKGSVSPSTAEAVLDEWNAAKIDIEHDHKAASFDEILEKAFIIHEVTMLEASQSEELKTFPSECLDSIQNILDQIPMATESESSQASVPTQTGLGLFETPDISAENLNVRLEQLDITYVDMANQIGVHHQTVSKWTREGVPVEFKKKAYQFLTA